MSKLVQALDRPSPHGLANLGGTWDTAVLEGLSAVATDPAKRDLVANELSREQAWRLLGWSEAACSWAVRTQSTDLVLLATQALTMLEGKLDARDLLVVATLAHRAALRLGYTLADLIALRTSAADALPAWVMNASTDLPPTHTERGKGPTFEFQRKPSGFDPAVLQALLDDDRRDNT